MIVEFNPDVFNISDEQIVLRVFQIILAFFDDAFLWDIDNIDTLFISKEGDFAFKNQFESDFLTPKLLGILEEKIGEAFSLAVYNTQQHKKYLSHITIGIEDGEIHPNDAYRIITQPSLLVLENGVNDWKFLKGLINNFANYTKRGSIYSLIRRSLENEYLTSSNAGGGGGIKAHVEDFHNTNYNGISQYKIFVFFDSDRDSSAAINTKYRNLLNFLKGRNFILNDSLEWVYQEADSFLWHMSYKRELENYVPLSLLFRSYPEIAKEKQEALLQSSNEYQDFLKFDKILPDGYKSTAPNIFETPGLATTLEAKCSHHKVYIELPNGTLEEVTEIEQILLMIAKII